MCSPAIAVPLVIGAIQSSIQIAQAKRQANAAKAQNKLQAQAAEKSFATESTNIQLNANKAAADAAEARFDNSVQAIQRRGEARAAFASSGVTGGALQDVLNEFSRQESRAGARIRQNLKFTQTGNQLARNAAFQRTIGATAANRNPNTSLNALDIGGAVLGGVNTGLSLNRQFTK